MEKLELSVTELLVGYRYRVECSLDDTDVTFEAELVAGSQTGYGGPLYFGNGVTMSTTHSATFAPLDPLPREHLAAVEREREKVRAKHRRWWLERGEEPDGFRPDPNAKGPDPAVWEARR